MLAQAEKWSLIAFLVIQIYCDMHMLVAVLTKWQDDVPDKAVIYIILKFCVFLADYYFCWSPTGNRGN